MWEIYSISPLFEYIHYIFSQYAFKEMKLFIIMCILYDIPCSKTIKETNHRCQDLVNILTKILKRYGAI